MKLKHFGYILPIILLLLSACESGAKFRVINATNHPAYASVANSELVTIPGGEEYVFDIDTDTQSFLTGEVKRKVPVVAYGETYSLIDDISRPQQDSTEITLKAGKTLNAFLHANRASVKIVNNLDTPIVHAEVWQNKVNYLSEVRIASFSDIAGGTQRWLRVRPVGQSDPFYYQVKIYLEGSQDTPLIFGDIENLLAVDEQFLVELNPTHEERRTKL